MTVATGTNSAHMKSPTPIGAVVRAKSTAPERAHAWRTGRYSNIFNAKAAWDGTPEDYYCYPRSWELTRQ
jgi:hypothetical protein